MNRAFTLILTFLITHVCIIGDLAAREINILKLRSGTLVIDEQTHEEQVKFINNRDKKKKYYILSFDVLPSNELKSEMHQAGIRLFGYLPNNSFYAELQTSTNFDHWETYNISSIIDIPYESKFHKDISNLPEWAKEGQNALLFIHYFEDHSEESLSASLDNYGVEIIDLNPRYRRALIKLPEAAKYDLGNENWIYFIQPNEPPPTLENYGGRAQHRSNQLYSDHPNQSKYDGTGVGVGIHDSGFIGPHIDYEGRVPLQFTSQDNGDHGDHVAGTIFGAGNLDPEGRGMAPGAELYTYYYNNGFGNSINHYNQYGIYITSTSLAQGCNAGYQASTEDRDDEINITNSLMHVYSAGNEGSSNCGYGAGAGWGNITGGMKQGKNVIACGALTSSDQLASFSSRGPAEDGRIKPDICAKGVSVNSTVDPHDYDVKSGTSMSAPGVSGSLAQLYHAYMDMNSGQTPNSGLIKGIVLNTADELGNPGPDFKHGWGRINLRRAMDVLQNSQYIVGSMSSTSSNTHSISVPSGLEEVRIMVYWHDYPGNPNAAIALVNNIDMTVTDPSNTVYQPWVLDPTPNAASLDSNAVRGVDSLNNMEQVTIKNPAQGSYTVTLNPTAIPQGPQTYHVIYEFVYDEIYVTYPNGGEGFVPGETETIRWDASDQSSSFDIDYSTDGGVNWSSISTSVNANTRQLNWMVPNDVNGTTKVRVSRGLVSDQSDENFSIVGVPGNLRVEWACPDSLKLAWDTVASAMNYTAYKLGAKYMDSTGVSSTNEFIFRNTNPNETYWLSVSANTINPASGRRAVAIQTSKGTFNCPLKNDLTLTKIVSPSTGNYPDCVTDTVPLKVYVKNTGTDTVYSALVKCHVYAAGSINANTGSIAPGDSLLVTFPADVDLAAAMNEIECILSNSSDLNPYNDTARSMILFTTNTTTVLSPWSDAFEDYNNCSTDWDCGDITCNIGGGWLNDPNSMLDDHDWRLNNGTTPSGNTGPFRDFNPGADTGMYVYTEASNGCNFTATYLTSPCMDLTEMSQPRLTWRYHMFGFSMGSLHVDVLTNQGWQLDVKEERYGNLGDNWWKDSLDLEPYAGQIISVRFRGITGEDYASDMALDDINLFESDPFFGIDDKKVQREAVLYPNPGRDIFFLEWAGVDLTQAEILVLDISGKSVLNSVQMEGNSERMELDMSGLERGTYLVRITSGDNSIVKKLIKL